MRGLRTIRLRLRSLFHGRLVDHELADELRDHLERQIELHVAAGLSLDDARAAALRESQRRVKTFRRDGWARPWPAGAAMLAYMISHDAHDRGQVCMLAHQLGFPLPTKAAYGIWVWEKLWKECGFTHPR